MNKVYWNLLNICIYDYLNHLQTKNRAKVYFIHLSSCLSFFSSFSQQWSDTTPPITLVNRCLRFSLYQLIQTRIHSSFDLYKQCVSLNPNTNINLFHFTFSYFFIYFMKNVSHLTIKIFYQIMFSYHIVHVYAS